RRGVAAFRCLMGDLLGWQPRNAASCVPRGSLRYGRAMRRRHANTGNIYRVPTPSTPPSRHPLAWMPLAVVALGAVASAVHGPIAQPAGYHAFADRRAWGGIAYAGNVLSNLGFALVGGWLLHA